MKEIEFKEYFLKELKDNDIKIDIDDTTIDLFYKYMNNIIEWNTKINVTSITEEKLFIVKHYLDSLTLSKYIKENDKMIDIGTGAGFPGIPLKLSNPNLKITLIDSINKKLNVIRDSIKDFNLSNIEIIHSRAEDLARNNKYREQYDIATTRAVSNLSTILEYMMPFIKLNGFAICMKGPNYEEELKNSQKAISLLGGKLVNVELVKIDNEIDRNIVIIKKVKNTSNIYPRSGGKPLKEPIN